MTYREITKLVDDMVSDGTEYTSNGSWCFYYDEYGDQCDDVKENVGAILEELWERDEVAEADADADSIDVMFYTGYCQNVGDDVIEL